MFLKDILKNLKKVVETIDEIPIKNLKQGYASTFDRQYKVEFPGKKYIRYINTV